MSKKLSLKPDDKCCSFCGALESQKGALNRHKKRYLIKGFCLACYNRLYKKGNLSHLIILNPNYNKRLRNIYHKMISRCYNANSKDYFRYGGRGIVVNQEWIKYPEQFYKWAIESGYSDNLTLDRKFVNGDYEPDNCRWVNVHVQQSNKRNNNEIVGVNSHYNGGYNAYLTIKGNRLSKHFKDKNEAISQRKKWEKDYKIY